MAKSQQIDKNWEREEMFLSSIAQKIPIFFLNSSVFIVNKQLAYDYILGFFKTQGC